MNDIEQSLTDIDRNIGRRIYHSRIMLGYSRMELAAEVGVTVQQLAKYESAQNRVPVSRLVLISKMFGRKIDYFVKSTTKPEKLFLIDTDTQKLSSHHIRLVKKLTKVKNDRQLKALIVLVDGMIDLDLGKG